VVLRQLIKQKARKEKVLLLGHSSPITEALFTNDVRRIAVKLFQMTQIHRILAYAVFLKMAKSSFGT
jgi:hypothetical protein